MSQTGQKIRTAAVIDIGTSAIRMAIAEIDSKANFKVLERLQKPVRFGHDVFSSGRIGRAAMNEAVKIMTHFKQVCDGYGTEKIHAIATSAVREASNRENFVDRVFVRTGIEVEIIEGPEENRLELIAVESSISGSVDLEKELALIIEIGSGSTDLILLEKGRVEVNRTLSMGAMRFPEREEIINSGSESLQKSIKRHVKEITSEVSKEYDLQGVTKFITVGADMRLVSTVLDPDPENSRFRVFKKKPFVNLVGKMGKMNQDEISKHFGIPMSQSENIYTALLFYYHYLNETQADEIIVPMASIRDGVLIELAQLMSGYKRTDVSKQIVNAAKHLAERYKYDKPHALCVAGHALKLFDELSSEHGMGGRERLLLEVSAILHDIGSYISPTGHHKHSAYLVRCSEIFGLRKPDKNIVANVVRYHRKSIPRDVHVEYMSLPKMERSKISKLAAILRIADALDCSHQQKIKTIEFAAGERSHTIWVPKEVGDISFERSAIENKGRMFADVYGTPVVLRRKSEF